MLEKKVSVVVVGSINMDLVARCVSLPVAGQTIHASGFEESYGGKGANQAVAAARAGGSVQMVGRVGEDSFGKSLLGNLQHEGVDCSAVSTTASAASGLAMIAVDDDGENQIIVISGANGFVSAEDVHHAAQEIVRCDVLLLQLEIPLDAVAGALAVRWTETNDLTIAVRFANAAGAIAATKSGAQTGMPTRIEIDTFLQS